MSVSGLSALWMPRYFHKAKEIKGSGGGCLGSVLFLFQPRNQFRLILVLFNDCVSIASGQLLSMVLDTNRSDIEMSMICEARVIS